MQTKIQKWGNSLGLRIPAAFAKEAHVGEGSVVDVAVEEGELVIRSLRSQRYDLESLVQGISAANLHEAVDTGPARGREAW